MIRIKAHFDYISRNGEVGLENEAGQTIQGRESVMDLRDEWKYGLYGTPEDSHRKEAFNIVLSMPAGTDRQAVKDAARVFAATEFAGNHQYVFAAHDDEDHPHVHLCVKAVSYTHLDVYKRQQESSSKRTARDSSEGKAGFAAY